MLKYYAELLTQINVLCVYIEESRADFSDSTINVKILKGALLVERGCSKYNLPIPLINPDLEKLPNISIHDNFVEIRIRLKQSNRFNETNILMEAEPKWSATYLRTIGEFSFNCGNCRAKLINKNRVSSINAMPSEMWAELMEFWHCHKPGSVISDSGLRYGNLKPRKGTIILGFYYVLFHPLSFETMEKEDEETIACANCGFPIGVVTKNGSNWKVHNWNLLLAKPGELKLEYFPPYIYAYSILLDMINSNGTRFVRIKNLLIWIFGTGVTVTLAEHIYENSMKIMYMSDEGDIVHWIEAAKQQSIEYMEDLPDLVLSDTKSVLEKTNECLPDSCKLFENWKIGFLPND
ncbi:BA75_02346T0 [Komagataella pastoris]|uniref:BA75_02346T0 n=1 Tax=Komagataella pastoris TaxID=4922 RepID=A0A1B2JBV3_PICPA|nr:BA75_02346T0 [Komagataella pastoris]